MTTCTSISVIYDFDYGDTPPSGIERCEESVSRITAYQRGAMIGIVETGKELIAVKLALGHGKFGPWIKHYFGWDVRSAQRMMLAAEVFGKCDNLSQMTIDTSALYLLASNKCPDETRVEFIERAENGERITHAAVKNALSELTADDDDDEEAEEDDVDDDVEVDISGQPLIMSQRALDVFYDIVNILKRLDRVETRQCLQRLFDNFQVNERND